MPISSLVGPRAQIIAHQITKYAQRLTNEDERNAPKKSTVAAMRSRTFVSAGVGDDTERPTLRLKKILVPIDFSPASEDAFRFALHCAGKLSAELMLLHVLASAVSPRVAEIPNVLAFSKTALSSAEKNLRALVASKRNGSVSRIRWATRVGVPSHEIVETAKEADIDLIIIATHGHTSWKHFCIGSTSERVVCAAPCPVLVVREKEHEVS